MKYEYRGPFSVVAPHAGVAVEPGDVVDVAEPIDHPWFVEKKSKKKEEGDS